MSITELILAEGPFAAAYLLTVAALAFGVIPVTEERLNIARNCILASCAIFAGIAIMWGTTTELSFWWRAFISGPLIGLAGIAAIESVRFITHEQISIPMPGTSSLPQPPPRFEATNRSTITTKGSSFRGTIPFPIGRADGDSRIDMTDTLWILPDAPIDFPAPTGEFSKLSNEGLKKEIRLLVLDLRDIDQKFKEEKIKVIRNGNSREEIERQIAKITMVYHKYATQYNSSRLPTASASLATEILKRIGGYDPSSFSQLAQIGAQVILQGRFVGNEPGSAAAEFLEAIAGMLAS